MQTATTPSPTIRPAPVATGTVIGRGAIRGWDGANKAPVEFSADVVAGPVLASGVTDIQSTALDLITRNVTGQREHAGLVGFVRNGDAWDAVALLAPDLPGGPLQQLWGLGSLRGLRVAPGVQLDAIWQISAYGGDMRWRAEHPMIPELR